MKAACLMMLKNETLLLEPWLIYHGVIFGFENLFVYDNGSTDLGVREVLDKYQAMGVSVVREYDRKEDFERKGSIFVEKIKSLEVCGHYSFFFPLDCDEFVVVEKEAGDIRFDASAIFDELESCSEIESPLMIKAAYDNNPLFCNRFLRSPSQRKTFFYKDTVESLDLGFHEGKTRNGKSPVKTNIAYVHYHYKPFSQYMQSAKQKLNGRVRSFSYQDLTEYGEAKGPGYHLVGTLLGGEQAYYDMHFQNHTLLTDAYYSLHSFYNYVSAIGVKYNVEDISECYELNEPRWKGHVDSIALGKQSMTVSGWTASVFADDLIEQVIVNFEGFQFESSSVVRTTRPDVFKSVRYAKEYCGFVANFDDVDVEKIDKMPVLSVVVKSGYAQHRLNIGSNSRGVQE